MTEDKTSPDPRQQLFESIGSALEASAEPGVYATDEEQALFVAGGARAIPDANRDRVLAAIAANVEGAGAAAVLRARVLAGGENPFADIHDDQDFVGDPVKSTELDSHDSAGDTAPQTLGGPHLFRLAAPAWALAASVALVSAVTLVLQHDDGSTVTSPQSGGGMEGKNSGISILLIVLVVSAAATVLLTPLLWKRLRSSKPSK